MPNIKTNYAPYKNGQYPEVKEVEIELGHHAFISPSQDYLLVSGQNQEDKSRKDNDIYVYFKREDGTWTKPINLGTAVNSDYDEKSPRITPDGKYLFFGRSERDVEPGLSNIYWVSTEVINKVRPVDSQTDFPVLEGPYLGQKPPGLVAEPFAPGIISKNGWEIEGVFAPGMEEFYFVTRRANDSPITVFGFRQTNNIWEKYTEFTRNGEVTFSPDGRRMFMADGYKDPIGDGWSERKSLGPMFDRDDWGIMRLSASAEGTYVFDDFKSGDVIRISTLKDGKRQEPEEMSAVINTGKWTAHPFIAPDESYLIWDSEREGGYGDSDLYISFRQDDGLWGPAINMGDQVNSDKWDAYASVTSDGKYILFNRHIDDGSNNDQMNVDIYWVDATIIETLRAASKKSESQHIKSPYLGQKPPGLIPEAFAPGMVTTEHWECCGVFTPDLKEFYFIRDGEEDKKQEFVVIKNNNNQWQESVLSSRVGTPFIAPDGKTMHLGKQYKERSETGEWSEIKRLSPPIGDMPIMRLTASSLGTYYFDEFKKDFTGSIRYSRSVDGKYEKPKLLSEKINGGKSFHPFIAPDESYLIFDGEREGGYGDSDIYISFREDNGSWGTAINFGEKINTDAWEAVASVTPDGKYLFFNRNMGTDKYENVDMFWVDAQIIETLRPK